MTDRQRVTIIYNDTASSVNKIVGWLVSEENGFFIVDSSTLGRCRIPIGKVVRVEEVRA